MTQKPETRLVNQILKAFKPEGGFWVKIHGSPWQAAGIPDIIGCFRGRFVALEVKMPGGQLSARQELFIARIQREGGVAQVVYNREQALGILEGIRRKK